jgi:hypothetical protein
MFATLKTLNRWSLRLSMLAIAAFFAAGHPVQSAARA